MRYTSKLHPSACGSVVVNLRKGDAYDIYIGRSTKKGKRNVLSNPYQIGPDGDRDEVLRKFAYDFPIKWKTDLEFRKAVLTCRGKRLGCFCKPNDCHGDIIVLFLDILCTSGEQSAIDAVRNSSWGD